MGSVASGLASAFGGAGEAATKYGAQVRGILEQRRTAFANLLMNQAQNENDLQRRAELVSHASDLFAGKDIAKVAPAVIKTIQEHTASDAALGNAFGGGKTQPTPVSGPAAPGQTPGTAAQPSTSLVSPQAQGPQAVSQPSTIGQGGVIPPIEAQSAPPLQPAPVPPVGAPSEDVFDRIRGRRQEILQRYHNALMSATPHMQPIIENEMKAELDNLGPWEQEQMRQANLVHLQSTPEYQAANPFQKLAIISQAYGYQPTSMMGMASLMRVHEIQVDATGLDPDKRVMYGIPKDASGKYTVQVDGMGNPTGQAAVQGWAGVAPTLGANGQVGRESINQTLGTPGGGLTAPGGGPSLPNSFVNPRFTPGANGQQLLVNPAQVLGMGGPTPTPVPGSTVPSLAGSTVANSTQQLPTGQTVSTRTTRRTPPGTTTNIPTVGGVSSVPTHDQNGKLVGNDAWKNRVNTVVSTLMTPNQSEGQLNAARKTLVGPERSPLAEAVRVEMAKRVAEDPGPIAWDLSTSERAQLSTQTLQHIKEIKDLIAKLGPTELGPVMSRWNEFWTGTIGSDLTKNQDYVKLKNNIGLLTKIMGRIHGGARGGGSIQMVENFKKDLSQERMDANTLNAALDTEANWLQTYANPKHTAIPQTGTVAPIAGSVRKYNPETGKLE